MNAQSLRVAPDLARPPALARRTSRSLQSQAYFWAATLGAAFIAVLPIWALHRESPRTLVSFHGFIHAAIAERFLDPATFAFPPENPFFAGRPVCYYWFFQFLAAQLARALGWSVFHGMEALIMIAMVTLVVAAAHLGRRLFHRTAAGLFIAFLVLAGTNPFGAVFAGIKVALQGTDRLRDDPNYLWGVVHPMYSLIRYNDVGGLYGPLLNFFLNITSRPLALAALLVLVCALEWAWRSHRPMAWLSVAGAAALTALMSSVLGIAAGGALLVGIAANTLWERRARRATRTDLRSDLSNLTIAGVAVGAGILLAAPTYYHLLLGPSDSHLQVWLLTRIGMQHLITLVTSVAFLVLLAVIGLRHSAPQCRAFLRILFAAGILLLAADATFQLPDSNQSNFFHAAVVLLSVPAAASILRRAGDAAEINWRRTAGIAAVFLPTVALLLSAYVHRPPLPLEFDGPRLQRLPRDSNLALLYDWVSRETTPDAVFIIDPRPPWVAMCGNISEFPAMTGRFLFTEQRTHYMVQPYSDSERRVDMAVRLASGDPPRDADRAYLADLARPVFLLTYRADDPALLARLQEHYGSPRFHDGAVAVFEWAVPPRAL
jgi:hypothetical protein